AVPRGRSVPQPPLSPRIQAGGDFVLTQGTAIALSPHRCSAPCVPMGPRDLTTDSDGLASCNHPLGGRRFRAFLRTDCAPRASNRTNLKIRTFAFSLSAWKEAT